MAWLTGIFGLLGKLIGPLIAYRAGQKTEEAKTSKKVIKANEKQAEHTQTARDNAKFVRDKFNK